jgi:uncharacterized RDD family membrane protein YckC
VTDPAGQDSLLDQRLEIETPERVVITHDLAGIGSRFTAGAIDVFFLLVPWCGAFCVLAAVSPKLASGSGKTTPEELQAVGLALLGVCYAIYWLYFLLFETFWGGRTPGKRFLRLRVMSVHGGPAPVSAVVLRNLLRVVDSIPTAFLPFLGGLVMFLNKRSQRIGDLVAGTVVVRERPEALQMPRAVESAARPGSAAGSEVSAEDLEEIDRFLVRRHELRKDVRAVVGHDLAERMRERYRLPTGDAEKILGLLGARRSPQQIRDLAGPTPAAFGMRRIEEQAAGPAPAPPGPPGAPPPSEPSP